VSENHDLWIECPDCEGCGGWYGCENCGALLSRDESPGVRECPACSTLTACVQSGGHEWGELHADPPGTWLLSCVRGCGATVKVNATWQRRGGRFAYVASFYDTEYMAEAGR
jgi:hypothetical protein